jgi:adenylate cyclase
VLTAMALTHYFDRNYADAVAAAEHAVRQAPAYPLPYRWRAAALGQLGRNAEAAEALRQALQVSRPGFEYFVRNRPPWFRPQDHEHMLNGLRKAGWQE